MTLPNTRAWFATTNWSLVLRAQSDPEDLARLLGGYWSPVYAFIRRSGHDPAAAADLTQEFISQVVLGRELIQRSDPHRGRFRTFLQTAVRNFLVDQHRRTGSRRRSPEAGVVTFDPQSLAQSEPDAGESPADAFDRQWATRVMTLTLEQLRIDCEEGGLSRQWAAFDAAVVRPAVSGVSAPGLAEIAAAIGATGPEQVSNMLQTVKRRFKRLLRETVASTLTDASELEDELGTLKRFLGV